MTKIVGLSKNYSKVNLPGMAIADALRGKGWLTLTQLTALLADRIPPEAGARFYVYYVTTTAQRGRPNSSVLSMSEQIWCGKRSVVRIRLNAFMARHPGMIQREYGNRLKEPRYRLDG